MNRIKKIIKKVVMAFFLIYGFNYFMVPLNLIIPMNYFTIISVSIFGIPMLMVLVIVKLIFIY